MNIISDVKRDFKHCGLYTSINPLVMLWVTFQNLKNQSRDGTMILIYKSWNEYALVIESSDLKINMAAVKLTLELHCCFSKTNLAKGFSNNYFKKFG